MRPKIQSQLSYVPIHLTSRYEEVDLGIGTSFFYNYENKDYLITNWHNVTGRHPWDYSLISKQAAIPDNLIIHFPYHEIFEDRSIIQWIPRVLKLYEDDERLNPVWWEHPHHSSAVDIIAIELKEPSPTATITANSNLLNLEKLKLLPGMDVFILGFPRGINGGGLFPIWKRGSIASEPDVNIDDLPKMYIDTATREGMSGSPVYAKESGFWVPEGIELLDLKHTFFGKGYRFLGIYSGRVGNDPFLAQLGIVWKEKAIQDIILSQRVGISSFELIQK
ncbi:trypsin-like peptidase domain-containing protein [Altericista sp. CCNU0014]|uniref:trypsin-like peptidase domain-containing protein n=1 Tax=Altericista sp. CCNU0014 TaxID=3082949 RepID=UPI00384DF6A8